MKFSNVWNRLRGQDVRRKRVSQSPAIPAAVESMEVRQMLSASALFIPATGELYIELNSSDSVRVSSLSGAVLIENAANGGAYTPLTSLGTVASSSVVSLVVLGGDDANTIDLDGVTAAAFTSLTSISVDAANGQDTIIGSPDFDDSINGGHGEDTISGQGGDDTIIGGDGNDLISGGTGNDSINSGDGDDSVTGDDGDDSIAAGNGQDTISGGNDNDTIAGANGQDSLLGDAGNDVINGDGGTDTVNGGDDNDSILGGEFADLLNGDAGNDTINGQAGNDTVDGGSGDDSLRGGSGNDLLIGNLDNDSINGEIGNDQVSGGDGNDTLSGGAGQDSLNGNAGNDHLFGQGGNDTLIGGGGTDSLQGGAGNDYVASNELDVSISSAVTQLAEGDSGSLSLVLTVSLSFAGTQPVSVDFATQDGTATAGSDYLANSGQLVFQPGVTSQTIAVTIQGDIVVEGDETFSVVLSNPVNAALGQATSTVTITDDDAPPPPVTLFDIQIVFGVGLTPSQQAAFATAELRLESIITGDVPDVVDPLLGAIDDVRIDASGVAIDGAGGILGQAGPNNLRPGSFLPYSGTMQFDTADLAALEASGQLTDTILHEMSHVLGFGTIWPFLNLLLNPAQGGGSDPRFTGALATQEFNTRFGTTGTSVPVEANGGQGTADGHWRDSTFDNELMTGFINTPGPNPLSRVTIAQFADLGYQVNLLQADPYLQAPASLVAGRPNAAATSGRVTRPVIHVASPDVLAKADGAATTGSARVNIVDTEGDTLLGGEGDDTIQGADGNDTLIGQGGNDSLAGSAGNDSLLGGSGADTLDGQAGDDTLDGQGGDDVLIGGDGNDTVIVGNGAGGDDTVEGGDGLNRVVVNGTNSADTIVVAQNNGRITMTRGASTTTADNNMSVQAVVINALGGDDTVTILDLSAIECPVLVVVNGGDGNDLLTAQGSDLGVIRLGLNGDNGNDTIVGSTGNDSINGGAGNDTANGREGNDVLTGAEGNDILAGGLDNDTVLGGTGNDFLTGQAGDDSIVAGDGNDTLRGFEGSDTLLGQSGDDLLNGMDGDDSILGGVGKDSVTGGSGNDTLDGGRNDDQINGNADNDLIRGDHGNDYINAGTDSDTVNGGDGHDTIIASDGGDLLNGGDGNDQINAGGGPDIVTGGDGNDTILGGGGGDVILGGDGDDVIDGQGGTDTVAGNQGNDFITDPATEIDEQFVLSAALLTALEAA